MPEYGRDPFLPPKPLLTAEQQQVLSGWILDYLYPYNLIIDNDLPVVKTSLELGRLFLGCCHRLKLIGCTPTIGQFEYAMHLCRFTPTPPLDSEVGFESYELSPRSPLLQKEQVKVRWK